MICLDARFNDYQNRSLLGQQTVVARAHSEWTPRIRNTLLRALVCTRLSLKPDLACKQVLVLFLLWSLRLSSYLSSLLIKCFVYFELRLFVSFATSYGSPLSWNGSRAGDVEQSICLRIVCRFSKSSGRSAGRELPVFAQF